MEEEKNKDAKLVSSTAQQAQTITHLLGKDGQNQLKVGVEAKSSKSCSPSLSSDNAPLSNQPYPLVFQWPNVCEQAVEEPPLVPFPAQSPSPVVLQNPVPQGQMPLHYLSQPATPFWLPQRSSLQPLTPMAPAMVGGASPSSQAQVPNTCYHSGYPFPGFPGPWDPSLWRNQAQQFQPPYAYNFPGAYGHFSPPTMQMPCGTVSTGQHFQRGTIQPPAKLSQKHKRLWEAQSAENVQLWAIIGQLQSELADYKGRLTKMEGEVSSLKPTVEERTGQVSGTVVAGQAPKRGRPRRTVSSVDALPSPKDSQSRARGRKPSPFKVHSQPKEVIFEKVILNKVENKEKSGHSTSTTQQGNNKKIPSVDPNMSGNTEMNGSNLMPEIRGGQECSYAGFNSSLEMRNNGNKAKVIANSDSATYIEGTSNVTLGWPSSINSEGHGTNVLSMNSQRFYDNGSVIKQGGMVVPGWSFIVEEGTSEELVGSGKDENEEEMEDTHGFAAEDIDHAKKEGAYNMDAQTLRTSRGLPDQFGNWPTG